MQHALKCVCEGACTGGYGVMKNCDKKVIEFLTNDLTTASPSKSTSSKYIIVVKVHRHGSVNFVMPRLSDKAENMRLVPTSVQLLNIFEGHHH